jgi:hypothetical protein
MAIQDDLRVAIEKNLSAEVGATLKRVLDKAESDASALALSKMSEENLRTQLNIAQGQVKSQEEVEGRIRTAKEAERKVIAATALKEITDLTLANAKERVADMKYLVGLVFQNNFYKYQTMENGSLPAGVDQYGNPKTTGYNRTMTGEGLGAPPPPPVGSP